jgi:hypothetical protein
MGLTATFSQSVVTDPDGSYSTTLFPGYYRVVAAPERDTTSTSSAGATNNAVMGASISAMTQRDVMVEPGSGDQRIDVHLSAQRIVRGKVLAGWARVSRQFQPSLPTTPASGTEHSPRLR